MEKSKLGSIYGLFPCISQLVISIPIVVVPCWPGLVLKASRPMVALLDGVQDALAQPVAKLQGADSNNPEGIEVALPGVHLADPPHRAVHGFHLVPRGHALCPLVPGQRRAACGSRVFLLFLCSSLLAC